MKIEPDLDLIFIVFSIGFFALTYLTLFISFFFGNGKITINYNGFGEMFYEFILMTLILIFMLSYGIYKIVKIMKK